MSAGIGGGKRWVGQGKEAGWTEARAAFSELWQGRAMDWSDNRAEQLFLGVMQKLETRRRRRRTTLRLAITCAGVAVTILIGLGLVGIGGNGPLAHLLSHVHAGWFTTT